ncbi:MAG TPA: diaminopimelate decarboxylase [Ktedonobacterales bacterium]|nr:diaminopimelate decarboxylase [Ktedonobacterales bacterium]
MPQVPAPVHAHLWPETATVSPAGQLRIAGMDVPELARRFGTPLYLYDEATIRSQCRAYQREFTARWPDVAVAYAGKAYMSLALCALLAEEGMELDVVSAGELGVALAAGFAAQRIHLHGNFKPDAELAYALDTGVGRIVVDSVEELARLESLARERGTVATTWLRVNPNILTDTHAHIQTGYAASKFGLSLGADAWDAATLAARSPALRLVGLHAHVGSQITDLGALAAVTRALARFAADLRQRTGVAIRELSPGGGLSVAYTPDDQSPSIAAYAEAVTSALRQETERLALDPMRLIVEPGRSLVARAGVALYTVGPRKVIRDGPTLVAVDGGMGDNPRPALYGARYHAALANRMNDPIEEAARVVGRYCESGDTLADEVALPRARAGDLLGIPVSGAYHLPMASNYNGIPRPAVAFMRAGTARLVRRRETLEDMLRSEVVRAGEVEDGNADN